MNDLERRLREGLEPVLSLDDPREQISAYHDMPYALFRYDPEEEFELRGLLRLLETRLAQRGKRVHRVSLAECLDEAMRSQNPPEAWFAAERSVGVSAVVDTVHAVFADYVSLVDLIATRVPAEAEPHRDVVLISRVGALFPMYRTFSLLEQLKEKVQVPAVLFYPGTLDGPSGLRFMGVLEAEHNYRPKIF